MKSLILRVFNSYSCLYRTVLKIPLLGNFKLDFSLTPSISGIERILCLFIEKGNK